jgi:tRNA G26 N,N-dimethylase Trm1
VVRESQRLMTSLEKDKAMYKAYGKVMPLLTTVSEELPDTPFFMTLHHMASVLKCTPPPADLFRSAVVSPAIGPLDWR